MKQKQPWFTAKSYINLLQKIGNILCETGILFVGAQVFMNSQ
jgi:hypothetical protein